MLEANSSSTKVHRYRRYVLWRTCLLAFVYFRIKGATNLLDITDSCLRQPEVILSRHARFFYASSATLWFGSHRV